MAINSNAININPNKVAIYPRWSTDEQTSGTTLETQLTSCKNYILSQGWNINEDLIFIDDGYTGANLNRPEITRLREYIQDKKVDCVIVYKLDRLSRNLRDAVNLVMDEWLDICYLKSVTEPIDTTTPLGKQIFYILMGFAEMERDVIKERTWSGKVIRAREGKNAGFRLPYSYTNELGKPGYFILIPEEAKIVRFIFDEYLKGQGLRQIANYLNENGITRRGVAWDFSSISYLLSNPFYYGELVYGRHSENREWIIRDIVNSCFVSDIIKNELQKIIIPHITEADVSNYSLAPSRSDKTEALFQTSKRICNQNNLGKIGTPAFKEIMHFVYKQISINDTKEKTPAELSQVPKNILSILWGKLRSFKK